MAARRLRATQAAPSCSNPNPNPNPSPNPNPNPNRRLVTISGAPGVGNSCVAVFALNYLAERHYFSDGVIHVEVS